MFSYHTAPLDNGAWHDLDDLLGTLPEGPVPGGQAAPLLKTGECPRSADTSSEASASTEIDAGKQVFSSTGCRKGAQEESSLHGPCILQSLFSPLSSPFQVDLAPNLREAILVSSPFSSLLQLSAPTAPRTPGVGPPPFRATCQPARTPAGADPKGLRAHLPALCGCALGLGWSRLGYGVWPGGVSHQE